MLGSMCIGRQVLLMRCRIPVGRRRWDWAVITRKLGSGLSC